MRGARGADHIEARITTRVRETTHTYPNLKAMSLWILFLIRCSTFTFLSDVGHITHTCTQHSPSSVSPSIHHAPPSSGSYYYLLVSSLLLSSQMNRHKEPLVVCTTVAAFCTTDRLPRSCTIRRTEDLIPL